MYIREEWSLYVYKYLIGNDAGNQSDPGAGGGGCKSGASGIFHGGDGEQPGAGGIGSRADGTA